MNKVEYSRARLQNNIVWVLWNYALEKGYKRSFEEFSPHMMIWQHQYVDPTVFNTMVNSILEYYDIKYNLIMIFYNNKLVKII